MNKKKQQKNLQTTLEKYKKGMLTEPKWSLIATRVLMLKFILKYIHLGKKWQNSLKCKQDSDFLNDDKMFLLFDMVTLCLV